MRPASAAPDEGPVISAGRGGLAGPVGLVGLAARRGPGGAGAGGKAAAAAIAGGSGKGVAGQGAVGQGSAARNLAGNQAGNRTPGSNLTAQQQQHAQNIRNNIQNNHNGFYGNHNNWYNHNWWNNHGGAWNNGWNYWHGWGPGYFWGGLGVGALSGFMLGSWGTPYYYGYGAGGNVAYQNGGVYVNGQYAATPDQYYDQTQQIASTPSATMPRTVIGCRWACSPFRAGPMTTIPR